MFIQYMLVKVMNSDVLVIQGTMWGIRCLGIQLCMYYVKKG